MEEAIDKYMKTEEECRFDCEKPFDQGWYPDFVSSVASRSRVTTTLVQYVRR